MKYLSISFFLALATSSVSGQTAMPVMAPSLAANTNPDVTAPPATQTGTVGPTTQVVTHQHGETFVPVATADAGSGAGVTLPPSTVTVGMSGLAAVGAGLL